MSAHPPGRVVAGGERQRERSRENTEEMKTRYDRNPIGIPVAFLGATVPVTAGCVPGTEADEQKAKKGNPNPTVLPVLAHAFGTTYGDLALQ